MRQTSGTARTAASTLTGKNPSPRKIRKVWPAPMANALSRARARAASSLPDQRTSRLPEASQKASPKRMPGNRAHQRFVEVFHGLDKMRLAEDEVGGVRLDDGHHGEFHGSAPAGCSYAIHGRPPEGDFKPPQAADFAPYHAATHVSASTRVSNTWTSITGDVGRDCMGKTSRKFPAA